MQARIVIKDHRSSALTQLVRVCQGLQPQQGRIARRNARGRVKKAVAAVLAAMDREFPLIRKERVQRAPTTALGRRRRRLAALADYRSVTRNMALDLLAAKVPVKTMGTPPNTWFVRKWILAAIEDGGIPLATITKAARSRTGKAKILALLALKRQP
jgi:hypothetical protein